MGALESFHPAIREWFRTRLGEPTTAQLQGWAADSRRPPYFDRGADRVGKDPRRIPRGLDALMRQGEGLPDETRLLYVSPLRALSNDVQKNLQLPLSQIRAARSRHSGGARARPHRRDTTAAERAAMMRRPPHILVTTPESLYILLAQRARARHAAHGRDRHRGRDPRRGARTSAAATSPSRSSGSRPSRAGRSSASASRPRRSRSRTSRGFWWGATASAPWWTRARFGSSTSASRFRPLPSRRCARTSSGRRSTRAWPSSCAITARRSCSSTRARWPSESRRG